MHFRVAKFTDRIPNNSLLYRPEEYSFDVSPVPEGGICSVLFDDLHLELNSAGKVISVWGMCPHTRWTQAVLTPPQSSFGEIIFVSDSPPIAGASVRLNKDRYRPVLVDTISGWVHATGEGAAASSIQILNGVILDLTRQGNLSGLWLRPQELPKL
jgi:hypothetical protein